MDPTLHKLELELTDSLRNLTSSHLQIRSQNDPTRWNILEIVQHLLLTYSSTTASIQARLEKGRPTRSAVVLKQHIARLSVLTFGCIPVKHEAPPEVSPSTSIPDSIIGSDQLVAEISASLSTMDATLRQAQKVFGKTACQSHFVLGPMSIPQWRRFHLVHGRHHIHQILRIRRAYGF